MKNQILMTRLLICTIVFLSIACKKSASDDLTVIINSPVEGTTYTSTIDISFSIQAPKGLDSCIAALTDASGSIAYYFNNFIAVNPVRNKTSFTYSFTQDALPNTLTPAKFTLTVVDLQRNRFTKTINIQVQD